MTSVPLVKKLHTLQIHFRKALTDGQAHFTKHSEFYLIFACWFTHRCVLSGNAILNNIGCISEQYVYVRMFGWSKLPLTTFRGKPGSQCFTQQVCVQREKSNKQYFESTYIFYCMLMERRTDKVIGFRKIYLHFLSRYSAIVII